MNIKGRLAMLSYHTCPLASLEGKETGGLNVYVFELSKALAKLGYTIDMFTRSQDDRQPAKVSISPYVRLLHVPAGPQRPLPKSRLSCYLPQFVANIRKLIKKERISYNLIHAHYYLSALAGQSLVAAMTPKVPMLITFHTLGLMKNLISKDRETVSRIRAEYNLIQKVDHIITTSSADREYLTALYHCPPSKITVVPAGVDTHLFRPLTKQEAKTAVGAHHSHYIIMAVGRIEPVKGFDVLLYAVKILLSRRPKIKNRLCLWIVGGDVSQKKNFWSAELKHLTRLRHILGIEAVVKFIGQQPQEKLPSYYNAADVVVMPSHYESFGMVALEAMACGTPVIATDVAGVSNLIQATHEGHVVSANNPLGLAEQLEHFIFEEASHARLGQSLRKKVKKLDWAITARHVHQVYQKFF